MTSCGGESEESVTPNQQHGEGGEVKRGRQDGGHERRKPGETGVTAFECCSWRRRLILVQGVRSVDRSDTEYSVGQAGGQLHGEVRNAGGGGGREGEGE